MDTSKPLPPSQDPEVIDLRIVVQRLWQHKWFFVKIWVVTFALSCVYILPEPRIYSTSLTLAPEVGGQSAGGALSSLASSFGVDLGGGKSEDAFYPELYPDVMSTNEFLVDMLGVRVKTQEGVDTTYMAYLTKYQKYNPITRPYKLAKRAIMGLFSTETSAPLKASSKSIDPRNLSRKEDQLVDLVRHNITCDVDIKTQVITITAKGQDPLVCATMADSARARLQKFITVYRTSKARVDLDYYTQLTDSAQREYDAAVAAYSDYCDTHQNVILQRYISERDKLENDMQTKLNTLNAMRGQLEAARAKVQERTPAFNLLQSAVVPIQPIGPKRMIFVAFMLFLAFWGGTFWIFRKQVKEQFLGTPTVVREEA